MKWTDKSGKINFSGIKKLGLAENMNIQVMPNPFIDKLNVNFLSDGDGTCEIRLITASGNLIKTAASTIKKGYNTIELWDLHSLISGLYIANIVINGRVVASLKVLR